METAITSIPNWNQHSKVVQFPDPIENLQQTLNLLKLPAEVGANSKLLLDLHSKVDAIQEFILKFSDNIELGDKYMPPKKAYKYLGMCESTFEKYRYKTKVKIKGYPLDGKYWFKKSDLDRFMMLYQVRSEQLA